MTDEAKTFSTVWDAIAKTPEEATVMKARADLMIALTRHIKARG